MAVILYCSVCYKSVERVKMFSFMLFNGCRVSALCPLGWRPQGFSVGKTDKDSAIQALTSQCVFSQC